KASWVVTEQAFKHYYAKDENVRCACQGMFRAILFRREIPRSTKCRAGRCNRGVVEMSRSAEVNQNGAAICLNHNILGSDVPVDYVFRPEGRNRKCYVSRDSNSRELADGSLGEFCV